MNAELPLASAIDELEDRSSGLSARTDELVRRLGPGHSARTPMFSVEVDGASTEEALDALALRVGNRWEHECRHRDGVNGRRDMVVTRSYTLESRVLAHHETPHGLMVVLREADRDMRIGFPTGIRENEADTYRKRLPPPERAVVFLVRGGYVYEVPPWGWDARARALTVKWLDGFLDLRFAPVYFFPMSRGLRWSDHAREDRDHAAARAFEAGAGPAPNPGNWYWIVWGYGQVEVPAGTFPEAVELIHPDNTGTIRRWLVPRIGVVKERYGHAGSYQEYVSELKAFRPAEGDVDPQ